MTPERWQRSGGNRSALYFQAALRRDATERAAFLDDACADDKALREKVEALLKSHDQSSRFIEKPALSSERRAPLRHSTNILTIHEIGVREGKYFIAAEYVDSRTLRRSMLLPGALKAVQVALVEPIGIYTSFRQWVSLRIRAASILA